MLKWAVTPRFYDEYFEQDGIFNDNNYQLLTLQSIVEQNQLPRLVRLVDFNIKESIDTDCLLLCETNEPYLIASNENERFSIPLSFDGLFAPVERGVTRYNILQSIRSLQPHLKTSSPSTSTSKFIHFTTLQTCKTASNSTSRRIHPGTILEPYCRTFASTPSLSPISGSSNRLRTFLFNLSHPFNKHILLNPQHTHLTKRQTISNDYFEVKSIQDDDAYTLKTNSIGTFVPVYTEIPLTSPPYRSSITTNQIQGLYPSNLLSQLTDQYPFITELIVSRTIEENLTKTIEYPFRRITLHRLVENHTRLIAFDMQNYTFVEIDSRRLFDIYAIEHNNELFQRYQAQLNWCHKHLPSFRSQIKTVIHSSNGTMMFSSTTPFYKQHYQQRRNSTPGVSTPFIKRTELITPESNSSHRLRSQTPTISKFHTTANHLKYDPKHKANGKAAKSNGILRKDVRVYFNDPIIQKQLQTYETSSNKTRSFHQLKNTEIDDSKDTEASFQCTAL